MSLRDTILKELTNRSTPRYLEMMIPTPKFERTDMALFKAKNALDTARSSWARIHETHQRRMKDESQLPLARLLSSAELAGQIAQRVEHELEGAKVEVDKRIKELRAATEAHLALPHTSGHAHLASEVRAHFKGLTGDERMKRAQAAMKSGDMATIKALVTVPAFLSGLPEPTHQRLRAEFLNAVAPDEVALGRELEEAREALHNGHGEFMSHVAAEIDWGTVETAKKAKVA